MRLKCSYCQVINQITSTQKTLTCHCCGAPLSERVMSSSHSHSFASHTHPVMSHTHSLLGDDLWSSIRYAFSDLALSFGEVEKSLEDFAASCRSSMGTNEEIVGGW